MENVTVYLNEARTGFIVCRKCGKSKQIDFASGGNPRSAIVKCNCGNTFSVTFEHRRHYRKKISSFGKCYATGDIPEGSAVTLVDISQSGIRFIKTEGRQLQVNEKIRISFSLGDNMIRCMATVDNVRDDRVGAKFMSLDDHGRKVLGFFLLP